jgi:hypothetical protein
VRTTSRSILIEDHYTEVALEVAKHVDKNQEWPGRIVAEHAIEDPQPRNAGMIPVKRHVEKTARLARCRWRISDKRDRRQGRPRARARDGEGVDESTSPGSNRPQRLCQLS